MSKKARKAPSVAIIGAGLSGIALAVRFKRAGLDDFEVFDKADGPGGTWWYNRYPGVGVDVPSALYSFSFKKAGPWKRKHATGAELRRYIEEAIDENGIRPHFNFGTEVTELHWNEPDQHWDLVFADGQTRRFKVVVPAVGMLDTPKYPSLPGMADFEGPMFHTARWEHEHDLAGKRIAYVGTGSTAAQAVPALAREVGRLDVYQREPSWALPKDDPELTESYETSVKRRPWVLWRERWEAFKLFESLGAANQVGNPAAQMFEGLAFQLLEIVEDPGTRAAMTPSYQIMCKRPVLATPDYFAAFNRENVSLVPGGAASFTADGVVDSKGVERKADVVVLSTGFQATNYMATIEVTGHNGRRLKDVWDEAGGAYAFLGMAIPRFPNLFMIYGPNSNVVQSAIFISERQADFVTRVVKRMARRNWGTVGVRPWLAEMTRKWVDDGLADIVPAVGGCSNWMRNENGKIITLFPGNGKLFWALTMSDRFAITGRPSVPRLVAGLETRVDEAPKVEVPGAA
jgi:cation diffusion facilitator CzcD-associated flavoprotein CzcO